MIPHAYVPSRSAKYFIADTNGQTMNSFQKPVLSLEIGSLNSVQPESSKATDTSDKITQCCFFNLLPPTITIHFFLILYAFFLFTDSFLPQDLPATLSKFSQRFGRPQ